MSNQHLVQILLPKSNGDGAPVDMEWFMAFVEELSDRFGGATSFLRAPAEGLWEDGSKTEQDAEYIEKQTEAHEEVVSLFKGYAEKGDDAKLKQFASETLSTLQAHLDHVKKLTRSVRAILDAGA